MKQIDVKCKFGEFKVYIPDIGRPDLILNDVFHEDVYSINELERLNPKTIVDIGAHCGFFSMAAKRALPSVDTIVCIEPAPLFIECLEKNVQDIGCKVDIARCAIRHDGRNNLYIDPATGMGIMYDPASNFCDEIQNYKHTQVETLRFDELYDKGRLGVIDVLKIDCEGSEFDILPSIPSRIRRNIRCIIGEYHHPAGFAVIKALLEFYYPHLTPEPIDDPAQPIGEFRAFCK